MPDDLVLCEPSGMTKVKRRFAIGNAFEAQVIEAYDKLWVRLVIPGAQTEPGIWSSKGAAEEAEWKHVVVGLHDRFKDVDPQDRVEWGRAALWWPEGWDYWGGVPEVLNQWIVLGTLDRQARSLNLEQVWNVTPN